MLDGLINKQQLIGDYLLGNYKFSRCSDTGHLGIFDKQTEEHIYGEEIEKDILVFYPFGKKIVTTVINVWINANGIERNSRDWRRIWVKPKVYMRDDYGHQGYIEQYVNQDIENGPIRLQTEYNTRYYDDYRYGYHRATEAETELVRGLAQSIIIELADDRGVSRLLNNCRTLMDLNEVMRRIGFERVEQMTANGRIIRWFEGDESFERRRAEYYHRLRTEERLTIVRERVNTQHDLIERTHLEREARLRHEEERARLRHEWRIEQERQENDYVRNNNIRRYDLF